MSAVQRFALAAAFLSLTAGSGKSSAQGPVAALPAASQTATSAPHDPSDEIRLDVAVTSKGKPAAPLAAQDFTLLDNNVPHPIASIKAISGTDAPVEVVIVVDSVNTPFTYVAFQRDQIAKYLRANDGMLPYPTTFAVLTDTTFNLYGKTNKNGGELAQTLDNTDIGLREINRKQGFYGADDQLTICLNALHALLRLEAKKPGRKLILWVSPGWPLLSGPELYLGERQKDSIYRSVIDFSTEMRQGDVTLYNINSWGASESVGREFYYESFLEGLKKPGDAQLGNLALQVLATQSGGLVLNSSDVIGMIRQCVEDADHYYSLRFVPSPGDKPLRYHDLKIKLAAPGLTARTRQGYYAQQ